MRIKPTVAAVVGPGSETQWGQVLQLPNAYGVLEVAVTDAIARVRGVAILSKLTNFLSDPPVSLRALEDVADEIASSEVISLLLLVPVGKIVYLVLRGDGRAYLKRGDNLAMLLGSAGSISGEVSEGDTLLLVSRAVSTMFTTEELVTVFDHSTPADVAEKLTLLLHERKGGEGGAALVFQVSTLVETEAEEETAATVAQPPLATSPQWRSWRGVVAALRRQKAGQSPWRVVSKVKILIAVFFLVLFTASVAVGMRRQFSERHTRQVREAIISAQHALEEGLALLPLNSVKGREKLREAQAALEPLVSSLSPRSGEGKQAKALYQQVTDSLTLAMQVYRLTPEPFYDVSLLKSGAQVNTITLSGESLVLLDGKSLTVFYLSLSTKRGELIAGGQQYKGAMLVAVHGKQVYTLVDNGIHLVNADDKKTEAAVVRSSAEWGEIKSMVAYGGNLYLLDTQKSRIWKYVATLRQDSGQAGFSELREYLNPDTLPDLSAATSMAIDGSVWLGTKAGRILKFTMGKETTFVPQGVEPALGQNLVVYTSDDTKNLYVLDRDNRRVVVLDKDGLYLSQYVWEGLNPENLVVSEDQKKILLLAEGKIYSLELR